MKISGAYTLPFSPEQAYRLMQDPEALARAIPGCETLEKTGDDEYRMKMKMVLASLSGAFEGKVRIFDPMPPSSFRMAVDGAGKIGFLKGEGSLLMKPAAEETEVVYDGEVQVGGTIAAVGQRLIDSTAKMMIKRFFEKLAAGA
ncbi:MAG TPA: carbon monoxide dehydrogenase subunit G [Bryobacteraceae bacterium]|nr:carbon monoxide dehydrogenase subunit G [Bryobacteraceae bacterium]